MYRGVVVILLLMWALLLVRLNAPWVGHHDGNGTWISAVARNYAIYGASELGYLQLYNPGPATPETYRFYLNHPPLITWTVTVFGQVFGQEPDGAPMEMAARLVSIFSTMIGMSAFFVIGRRAFGECVALWALALYALTPMIAYFGRMPNHEPLALLFLYIFAAVMLNWLRQPTPARWLLMLVCAVLAMWTAWASAFMLAAFGLFVLWHGRTPQRLQMIVLGGVTLVATAAIPLFYEWQRPGAIAELQEAFLYRSSNQSGSDGSESFTAFEFISRLIMQSFPLMTLTPIILGIWGLFARRQGMGIVYALMLGTVGYMLVFRNAFHIHDYYKIFFLPGLALSAAAILVYILRTPRLKRRWLPFIMAMLIISWAGGLIFYGLTHQAAAQRDVVYDITQAIKANSNVDDVVMSNWRIRDGMGDFYAYRNITWDVPPDVVRERAEPVVYLECLYDGVIAFGDLSDGLAYETVADCRIYRLDEEN